MYEHSGLRIELCFDMALKYIDVLIKDAINYSNWLHLAAKGRQISGHHVNVTIPMEELIEAVVDALNICPVM